MNNIIKSIDLFLNIIEEFLGSILEKIIPVLENRRGEITGITLKLLNKIYSRFDSNKVAREYLKMLSGNYRGKNETLNQLIILLKDN